MRAGVLLLLLLLGACDLSMQKQARHAAQSSPTLWQDGPAAAPSPDGTVSAEAVQDAAARDHPPHLTEALLRRGQQEHIIFCAPCHGETGEGDGRIVQRGFPRPLSYRDARLLTAPPAAMVDVIANGRGAMYGFSDKIAPADRWAIAAYIKVLQHVPAGQRQP